MITINLKPEIEDRIREKAKSQDLSVEQYIESLIEKVEKEIETLIQGQANSQDLLVKKYIENLVEQQIIDARDERQSELSLNQWENKLFKFINSPINSQISALSDEAISRENIYTREDEVL